MACGVCEKKETVQDKYTLARVRRYHSKRSDLEAWVEPKISFAVASGNQQVLKNGRPGQAFCITVACECGSRIKLYCRAELGEKNELVFLGSVARGQNLIRGSCDKSCGTAGKINHGALTRNKILQRL